MTHATAGTTNEHTLPLPLETGDVLLIDGTEYTFKTHVQDCAFVRYYTAGGPERGDEVKEGLATFTERLQSANHVEIIREVE